MALFALLLIFELGIRPAHTLDSHNLDSQIETSLNEAEKLFNNRYRQFRQKSNDLYDEIIQYPFSEQNRPVIFNRLQEYPFWGVSLQRDNERWIWNGYSLTPSPTLTSVDSDSLRITLLKRNNVVYLFGQRTFTHNNEVSHLLTAEKLEQTTNLPFADQVTFRLSDDPRLEGHYPVSFSFFTPTPEDLPYHKLSTSLSDSVGIVYADPDGFETYLARNENKISEWQSLLHALLTLFLLMTFTGWVINTTNLHLLQVQILLPLFGWFLFVQLDYLSDWIYSDLFPQDWQMDPYKPVLEYFTSSFFLLLASMPVIRLVQTNGSQSRKDSHFRTLFYSLIFGFASAMLLMFFFIQTQEVLIESSLSLLDLELAPDLPVFIFYITSALFFTAVCMLITSAGIYLYRQEFEKSVVIGTSAVFSFILSYYLIDLALNLQSIFTSIFVASAAVFIFFNLMINTILKYPHLFTDMSGFRKVLVSVLVISCSVYFIIWSSSSKRIDHLLTDKANAFANEEVADTQEILMILLSNLESDLIFLSEEDIRNRTEILQGQFQRAIQNGIRPEWRDHSFEIQLLDTNGVQISDYSTNLDSPGWRSLVDMELMRNSHRGEQIRRVTNRPIVWERPSDIGEEFISFNRGWIPIYDESKYNEIIAWIFAAAYLERPDYNKPIRAVLSASTEQDWKQSYYIAEFVDGRVNRTAMEGIYNNQPQYNRLPDREAEISESDSIAFITNVTPQGLFREILLKTDENKVIKASTPLPVFNQHLFSFFRYQIVLIFFGLFIFGILSTAGFSLFSLFGQSRKFRQRLLDTLTLSTILFLTVLIFATQHAVSQQNEKNVERELITKLNSLGESLRGEINFQQMQTSTTRLAELASPLNVDAILYGGANVLDSTTPQIFQQFVMPRTMPFDVYNFIYNRERRHYTTTTEIANETLLIGFRTLLDENNQPAGAVAIPTFVESPVYREQLLEATSSLFGIYLAIFGVFIIGTVILSNRLTRPLQIIQRGLNKISRGDMNTRVAVTGRDEIGSLAMAYNEMAERLEKTRKELVKAEREAAWKEMAQQVAHEIKNPLTPMKLNLQHLQRQLDANPDNVMELKPVIEKTAKNIIEQIESLNKIASDFSKFAKPIRAAFEPVEVKEVLRSVAELYDHDDSAFIKLTLPAADLTVQGAEDELRRVFINLVKNGIEASTSEKAEIEISARQNNSDLVVQITDFGLGIAKEDRDKIFVPNFSTKSSGTGLGLAITKKIIEAHHGDIRFESEEGKGTTFFVRLDLDQ